MPLMRRGPGIVGMAARTAVVAGTAGRVQHRQQQRWAEQEPQQQPAAPPAAAQTDYVAELERLAQLRDSGVITAADFDAKKSQILGI
jgi:membrane protease subunit (stomatin/prohibitin family)